MSSTTAPLSLQQEVANLATAVAMLLQLLAANETDATLQASIQTAVATIVTATNQVALASNLPGNLPLNLSS